jgi:NAD(P)-dependent dehydrogenase (short-subunit alcohol dehydrogenase family)
MDHGLGKVALVTGTSSGFGMLTAVRLARMNWTVYAGMRDLDRGGELLARAREADAAERIRPVRLDVTREDEIRAAVEKALAESGRIDALVNNAGFAAGGFLEEVPLKRWREQFETNVFGLVAVTQAVLPVMRKQGGGRIVLVGSVSGRIGFPGLSPYTASKHAVEGLGESLRLELAPFGISVSIVEPASYRTPIWEKGLRDALLPADDSPYAQMYRKLQPMLVQSAESGGDPEKVAAVIVRALTDRRPKLRYTPTMQERTALALKSLVPWSWFEWPIRRMLAGTGEKKST